ncbi:MAG TPA: TlpA disulfide reductase family protein [Terriglobia bacterium]|nr:TlpA disulfide reductase family protein [Terriglobia bacterium]
MRKLALTIVALVVLCSCTTKKAALAPSKGAPDFDLENIRGGKTKAVDLKGKVAVVDFWATWCDPCKAEVPHFNKLAEAYKGKDVQVVGIAIESPHDDIAPTMKQVGINYMVLVGNDQVVDGFGGVIGYPTTYIVTKDWKIYKKYLGALPDKEDRIRKDIDKLLAEDNARSTD